MEPAEVKENFDNHNLKIDEKSLNALFKAAAVNRRGWDISQGLSLYEFCIFSKKASADFQKLMGDIKTKMLLDMKRKNTSTLVTGIKRSGPAEILPKRKRTYIQYLPSSFNPLMNHFKDEEKRNDIREGFTKALEGILNIGNSKKSIEKILETNKESMKELLASHFPHEGIDEEERKLIAQTGNRKITMTRNSYLKPNLNLDKNETEKDIEKIRIKTRNEWNELVKTTRQKVKSEGIDFECSTKRSSLNHCDLYPLQDHSKFGMTLKPSHNLGIRKIYTNKLLENNLVLRNIRIEEVLARNKTFGIQRKSQNIIGKYRIHNKDDISDLNPKLMQSFKKWNFLHLKKQSVI